MKYKLFSISIMAGLLILSSCSKLLEEKSQSEVIPRTTEDFRELLIGSGYMKIEEPMNFVYFMDDDVDLFLEYANGAEPVAGTLGAMEPFLYYTWQPRQGDMNGLGDMINTEPSTTAYYRYYELIKGCNAVLDNIDASIGIQQDRDRVKGEALAVRAFYYFRLVNLYGEPYNSNPASLSVPLKLNSSITAEYLPQSTVADVYASIVNDLKLASQLMDPLPIARKDYHINQPAIHILLSRVYLFMEKWEDCVAEANKVFDQGGKLNNLTGITDGHWLTYANPEIEWMFGGGTQPSQDPYIPKAEFRGSFDENDVRGKYGFDVLDQSFVPLVSKYSTAIASDLTQSLRTSEAVLNRAEANTQLGQLGPALKDLNDIRRNRIVGYADVNISAKDALLQAVRDERRKEFCYEGFRWFDLRRYGMPAISHRYQADPGGPVVQYELKQKDPAYTLPFSNSLLVRNPALKQNPSGTIADRNGQ